MQKFLFWGALMLLLSASGCKKADEYTQFRLEYNTSLSVPATGNILTAIFDQLISTETTTNAEQSFSTHDTRADLIEAIRAEQLTLSITSPSNANFDFLSRVDLYLNAPGMAELKIASKSNIPNGLRSFDLDIVDNNLAEYLKKDKFTLRASITTDASTQQEIQVNIYSRFFVDAKILGI